jgi:hypothetical protein
MNEPQNSATSAIVFGAGGTIGRAVTPRKAGAAYQLEVINQLGPADSGGFFAWDGSPLPH